jgi:predicted amidohydrolase
MIIQAASLQLAVVEDDKQATIDKALNFIHQAADADLIILPELWNIGFFSFDRYLPEAETIDGPTLTAIRAAAESVGAYVHAGSLVTRKRNRHYNASFLIAPNGDVLAEYHKVHLFGHGADEPKLLTAGHEACVVETDLGVFGLAACYDLRFPELFRRMVDTGAEVFLVCSAWPYPRLEPWLLLNRVRALENQCFLISANSCGPNRRGQFAGHSMMVDPLGVVAAGAGDEEAVLRQRLDLDRVTDARRRFNVLADRKAWLNR